MSAVERWRARLPATERTLTYAGRAPKIFRSGRCGNPTCPEWVTTWITMGKAINRMRHRVARGLLWRPADTPPSRFCSDRCSDIATRRLRAPSPPPVPKSPPVVFPHSAKVVVGHSVWAGAYCRRPSCRAGFVTRLPVIEGELGPRPPFCSDACQRASNTVLRGPLAAARRRADAVAAAGKVLARRQPVLTPTLPDHIVVAGVCARQVCGQPFNLFTPLWNADGTVMRPPRFCSTTCWRREQYRIEDLARKKAGAAAWARRVCRTCWDAPKSGGYEICQVCFVVVQESCRRKRRRSEDAARDAAEKRTRIEQRPMSAYRCEVCRYWHIGGEVVGWRAKRVGFIASVFVATAPPGEVRRLVQAWNPHNMDLNQRMDGHAGLAALRDQLEAELEAELEDTRR